MMSDPAKGRDTNEQRGIAEQRHLGLTVSDGQEVRRRKSCVSRKKGWRFGKARRLLLERMYELLTFIF